MKIERILLQAGIIHHSDSRETREIKIDKKNGVSEGLKYVEDYCNENGFELFDTFTGQYGLVFTIVKR